MPIQAWSGPLVNSIVDGTANTTGAAASCIPPDAKITLPNNYWRIGRMLRVTAHGRISSVITTPGTARFDIRIGAVVAFDSLAILLDTVAAGARTNYASTQMINPIPGTYYVEIIALTPGTWRYSWQSTASGEELIDEGTFVINPRTI